MKIVSPYSKAETKVENLKQTSHKEYDKNGKLKKNDYVEFVVIGKNRKWKNFMSLNEFKKLNPNIKLD